MDSVQTKKQTLGIQEWASTKLPNVSQISHNVTRILGQNPGPFTLQGTNTYLVAGDRSSFLIDTGQGAAGYLELLEPVLRANPPVSDIILTHWHHDHVGGLPSVFNLICSLLLSGPASTSRSLPNVWKYKLSKKSADNNTYSTPDAELDFDLRKAFQSLPKCPMLEHIGQVSSPKVLWLRDQQEFQVTPQSRLRVLHTPGHTQDSICCLLLMENPHLGHRTPQLPQSPTELCCAFVGDTLLGGSTTVFEELKSYLESLNLLLRVIQSPPPGSKQKLTSRNLPLYPAHGPVIHDGAREIQEYIAHRNHRENQIIECLSKERMVDARKCLSINKITQRIYSSALPDKVREAARCGISQHLEKLRVEGRVREVEPDAWQITG